jgi:hypothetical protein
MTSILPRTLSLVVLCSIVMGGCASPTPAPTARPTVRIGVPTVTSAPTATPLATSTPTAMPAPTQTAAPTLAATSAPTATGPADCKPAAKFVSDVTVPDNTRFDKGAAFTKTWRVRNSGTCDWPADTALVFVAGDKLGADQTTLPVGAVKAGDTKDISVNLKAPNEDAAKLAGQWRLQSGGKALAGEPSLTVVIVAGNPVVATSAPPPPSAAPVAPPSSGPTMYGVHAHWAGQYNEESRMTKTASQIADLGVGWTKLQVRWGSEDFFYDCSGNFGFDWNHTNQVINIAGSKGLRVLFSVVTSPPCTHPATSDVEVPPDDVNVFAAFVGELASRYAGRGIAIEIWERENATAGLDAARYTQMLAASYNKIKAADPGIIVIGGAPAPYVVGGDTEPLTYLKQMKAAGADKYMDCIGVYFNDSTAPPDSSFFKGLLQGSQSQMGKQACITSFGVASEQNVGHIKDVNLFKDNTEANQADWTTQAMGLARQSGARMIILFNLDYGPLAGMTPNALYSFFTPGSFARPVYGAVKNWCAANGCK